jgi:hypothetical protein
MALYSSYLMTFFCSGIPVPKNCRDSGTRDPGIASYTREPKKQKDSKVSRLKGKKLQLKNILGQQSLFYRKKVLIRPELQ